MSTGYYLPRREQLLTEQLKGEWIVRNSIKSSAGKMLHVLRNLDDVDITCKTAGEAGGAATDNSREYATLLMANGRIFSGMPKIDEMFIDGPEETDVSDEATKSKQIRVFYDPIFGGIVIRDAPLGGNHECNVDSELGEFVSQGRKILNIRSQTPGAAAVRNARESTIALSGKFKASANFCFGVAATSLLVSIMFAASGRYLPLCAFGVATICFAGMGSAEVAIARFLKARAQS